MIGATHNHGTAGVDNSLAAQMGVSQNAFLAAEEQAMNNLQGQFDQIVSDGVVTQQEETALAQATAVEMANILGVELDNGTMMALTEYCRGCWQADFDQALAEEGITIGQNPNTPLESAQYANLLNTNATTAMLDYVAGLNTTTTNGTNLNTMPTNVTALDALLNRLP